MTERHKFVVIVDDDDAVKDSLQVVLEAAGYATKAYASGPDLLAAIDDSVTGCVLLDAKMPHMSGLNNAETPSNCSAGFTRDYDYRWQ